jgi:hypothetical protein
MKSSTNIGQLANWHHQICDAVSVDHDAEDFACWAEESLRNTLKSL